MRVVTPQELSAKSLVIQQKFDFVRNQLRTNVCNAILVLQKQYNHQSKKRRRSLSKRATDVLNQWFFDHINGLAPSPTPFPYFPTPSPSPYPSASPLVPLSHLPIDEEFGQSTESDFDFISGLSSFPSPPSSPSFPTSPSSPPFPFFPLTHQERLRGLSRQVTDVLNQWFSKTDNGSHPSPSSLLPSLPHQSEEPLSVQEPPIQDIKDLSPQPPEYEPVDGYQSPPPSSSTVPSSSYFQSKERRQRLNKQATQTLNKWFYDNLKGFRPSPRSFPSFPSHFLHRRTYFYDQILTPATKRRVCSPRSACFP